MTDELRDTIRRYYERVIARLQRRIEAETDIVGQYRLRRAARNRKKSLRELLTQGDQQVTIKPSATSNDGGPGSGNHGHKGRPGKAGGSAANGSAEGKNKPCTGFRDKAAEKRHQKHWKEFGVSSHAEYEKKAIEFIKQPVGGNIDGYERADDGAIIRFNVDTGEIGIGIPGGEIITFFKAKYKNGNVNIVAANNYFNALKKEEQYEQNDDNTALVSCV